MAAALLTASPALDPTEIHSLQSRRRILQGPRAAAYTGMNCVKINALLRSLLFKAAFCNRTHERDYLRDIETLALERLAISAKRLKLAASHMAETLPEPPQ